MTDSGIRRESHVLADISEVDTLDSAAMTDQAVHNISAMFPTVEESHIRDLLKKYVPYVGLIESIEKEYSDENSIHLYTEDDPLRNSSRSTRLYEKVTHPALHRQMLRQRAKKLQQQNKEFLVACERLKAKDI